MAPSFEQYITRKEMGAASFNFLVGDPTGQAWYDTPKSPAISEHDASILPFSADRTAPIYWPEMAILKDHFALPGSNIIECGCHHGLTTVMLAGWAGPSGFVHAFDAVLENAVIAKRNLALNGIENAAVLCAAIGGEHGIMRMHNESNVVVKKTEAAHATSTVMVRISSLFDRAPDALKLDIEGAELDVLEADRDFIAAIPRLAIEVHTDYLPEDGIPRMVAALNGRELHVLREEKHLQPYLGEPISERVHLFAF